MADSNKGRDRGDDGAEDQTLLRLKRENVELQNALHRAELQQRRSRLTRLQAVLGVVVVVLGLVVTIQTVRLNQLTIASHHERETHEILRENRYQLLGFLDKLTHDANLEVEDREAAALTAAFFLIALGEWDESEVRDYLDTAFIFDETSCFGSYGRYLIGDMEFEDIARQCRRLINATQTRR